MSTMMLPPDDLERRSGRDHAAPGHPASRRPGCTSSRGTGTRTTASSGTTAPGSRGARTSGTARRSPAPCPRRSSGYAWTFLALARSAFGIGDDVGLGARRCRRGSCCRTRSWRRPRTRRRPCRRSRRRPDGQRNASAAAPKAPSPSPLPARIDRLKNCRRVTPSSSSSTGSYSTGVFAADGSGLLADRCARLDRTARLVGAGACLPATRPRPSSRRSGVTASTASMRPPPRARVSRARRTGGRRRAARDHHGATTARATAMTMRWAMPTRLLLQLEEDAVVPGEHEVEPGSPEERTDDDEHRPEHQEDREDRDRELPVLRLVATGSCRRTAPP